MDPQTEALHRVFQHLAPLGGGKAKVASLLGITAQAVGQWRRCPADRAMALERATNGAVKAYELRPDVFSAPAGNGYATEEFREGAVFGNGASEAPEREGA